jgi:hypothetical protein
MSKSISNNTINSEKLLPLNYQQALSWINEQLAKPNQFNINLGGGIIINDLHKCLDVKRERLLNLDGYNQKVVFLQTKIIKDYLTKSPEIL